MSNYYFGPQSEINGLSIMQTPAGWYVGEWEWHTIGEGPDALTFKQPLYRASHYMATQEEAEEHLEYLEQLEQTFNDGKEL